MSEDVLRKLRVELSESSERQYKLERFIDSNKEFDKLDGHIQYLMMDQNYFMFKYIESLSDRITYMESKQKETK